ncbi:MAG: hypothetical protein M3Y33_07545 [Actinomycetota bacterium]|nr:hypothetical protein [Actinomycetota bacterium]
MAHGKASPPDWLEPELETLTRDRFSPHQFTVATVPGRLGGDDPWAGMPRRRYRARKAAERLSQTG